MTAEKKPIIIGQEAICPDGLGGERIPHRDPDRTVSKAGCDASRLPSRRPGSPPAAVSGPGRARRR